jgi:hypothetical protein
MLDRLKLGIAAVSVSSAAALTFVPAVLAQSASPAASATTAPTTTASFRAVHASPDAPAVDVYIDDKRTLASLTFRRVTGYAKIPTGRHTVKIYPSSAAGKGNPVLTQDLDLNAGWDYTIAVTGRLANIQAKVFSDNLNVPGVGKTNVRVYHLSPNAPAINVAVKGADTLVRNLSFPNATDYLQVDSKAYNLEVQTATDSKAVLDLGRVTLPSNSVESVFAFGLVGGEKPALSALTVVDRRGAANTPATGAEQSFGFMALVAGMVAAAGVVLKKIAIVSEQN